LQNGDYHRGRMGVVKPYHYIRFNWWRRVDLNKAADELRETFSVETYTIPWDERAISLNNEMNEELRVRADTLTAFLSPFKVVLFQRDPAPFTERDVALRKKMIELYPHERPTPFPFMFGTEPRFEVARAGKTTKEH